MLRLLKVLFILVVLIAAMVVGFAYLGDLSPEQESVSEPVSLDAD
jgi:Tfp pilus assembly protein PilO